MNTNLMSNLEMLQDSLNEYITPNWKENRTELDFMVASSMELSELIDTTIIDDNGEKHSMNWKWWKGAGGERTMDVVNWEDLHPSVLDNVKIELTDLVFFTLSQKILEDMTHEGEEAEMSQNDWLNFMSISANNLLQRPGMAMLIILELCKKIDFNVSAYYVSKHLLNYYRQISKYGDGYEKVKDGKEDNEHLHDIISDITLEQVENNFEETYNLIAERFFKIFKVKNHNEEINYSFWANS